MKRKLSAYWWCQIGGWSFSAIGSIVNTLFNSYSWSYRNLLMNTFFVRLFIIGVLGLILSHIMRLFILKLNILQKKINYQVIFLLLITLVFSITYSFSFLGIWKILGLLRSDEKTLTFSSLVYGANFYSFLILLIWNLFYFSYHYIQKSQKELIEKITFENELQLQKLESEKTKVEFQHRSVELEMQALRSQMNPHFIFNCLSSINRFILKNESEAASDYLTNFSRLIRMVLTHSKQSIISLDDELEMLRLYLEMERLRFKYSFDYSINLRNAIDPENVFIPPLLLQPFAENAIWHGMMNKEGQGHLTISVSQENNQLSYIIEDNGVGRAKAAELKSKSAEKKKSLGLQITKERLALLNKNSDETTFFEVKDMYDTEGNANGTMVILKIRLHERFEENPLIS